ncbi:MAG: hypothetical protein AB1422_14205 [bacterium]
MPTKLKQILIEGERFYFSLSFDIDDFIGDGVWWLQIYDDKDNPDNSKSGILLRDCLGYEGCQMKMLLDKGLQVAFPIYFSCNLSNSEF